MAAPALSANGLGTVNGDTSSATITLPAGSSLLVVRITCAADAGEIPQFQLAGTTAGKTIGIEDSAGIFGANVDTTVYKDGTSSTIAYDKILRTDDSTGAVYIWSIKLSGVDSGATIKANWTKNGTGTLFRSSIDAWTSAASIPVRASRLLSTYSHNGTATGAGDYSCTRDGGGTSPTGPCLAVGAVNASGTNTTPTVDFDADTTFETTVSAGQGDGRVRVASNQSTFFFDGCFDTSDAHLIHATAFPVKFGASPAAHKCIGVVVYRMAPFATSASLTGTAHCTATLGTASTRARSFSNTAGCTETLVGQAGKNTALTGTAHSTATLTTLGTRARGFSDTAGCTATMSGSVAGQPTASFSDAAHCTATLSRLATMHAAFADTAHCTATLNATGTRARSFTGAAHSTATLSVGTSVAPISPTGGGGDWTGGGSEGHRAFTLLNTAHCTATLTTRGSRPRSFANTAHCTALLSYTIVGPGPGNFGSSFAGVAHSTATLSTTSTKARTITDTAGCTAILTLSRYAALTDRAGCTATLTILIHTDIGPGQIMVSMCPPRWTVTQTPRWTVRVREAVRR